MAAVACKLSSDLARPIAIEVIARDSLEEGDVLVPKAYVLDGFGGTTHDTVFWFTPDSAIAVDSASGQTMVRTAGSTGRLLARAAGLLSNPLTIRTLPAADTVWAAGPTRDSVAVATGLSDSLQVTVADIIRSSTGADSVSVPLAGRPVVYSITHPAAAGAVTLVTSDTARRLVTTDTVPTGPTGVAVVKVRLLTTPPPDSVLVVANAWRATQALIAGSPVTFTVRFLP